MGELLGHVGSVVVVVALVLGHAVAGEPVAFWTRIFGFLAAADCLRAGRKVERDGCVGDGRVLRFGIGGGDDDDGDGDGEMLMGLVGRASGWWRAGGVKAPPRAILQPPGPASLSRTPTPLHPSIYFDMEDDLIAIAIFGVIIAILFSTKRADVTAPNLYIT